MTPHVAQNVKRNGGSAIDGRTTRSEASAAEESVGKRKRIEEKCFGWLKNDLSVRKVRHRSIVRR